MGEYAQRLRHRNTDVALKEDVVQALQTVYLPMAREIDSLKTRVHELEGAIEALCQAAGISPHSTPETP